MGRFRVVEVANSEQKNFGVSSCSSTRDLTSPEIHIV
jgi:hypothetical protein